MSARDFFLLFCGGLLLSINSALADGTYQRAKDGKTLVWNNDPKPGDAASWSGHRDSEGYATGYGTLTWFATKQASLTGSSLSSSQYTIIGSYSGNMVRGKLNGLVKAEVKGRTYHANFADGHKAGDWFLGATPEAWESEVKSAESRHRKRNTASTERSRNEPAARSEGSEPPAEKTAPVAKPASVPTAGETPKRDMDASLQSLISPPSLLRMRSAQEPSPSPSPSATVNP